MDECPHALCVGTPWATGPSDPCGEHSLVHSPTDRALRLVRATGQEPGFKGLGLPGEGSSLSSRGWDLLMGSLPPGVAGEHWVPVGLGLRLGPRGFPKAQNRPLPLTAPSALSPGGFPSAGLQADPGAPSHSPQAC